MTLGERIKELRVKNGLSQESLANMVGVSRQAVTKWESDKSTPSSDNLIFLANVFHVSLDELVIKNDLRQEKKPNKILMANLIKTAIILHAAALHGYTIAYYNVKDKLMKSDTAKQGSAPLLFALIPLLLCSAWMVLNHRFETDLQQRKKNIQIELAYCLIQLIIAFLTIHYGMGLVGALLTITAMLVNILVVNPKYMNRKLTK